ncbi:putative membrane protein [Enhygromyxa salina]|uniref:Putative membrane protein n=1 Tax=Enhygromyxa salina TaxID=215803 RepID=A0A0C2D272_9BACT|nr:bestrophin family ion channel [Enhygromyxa salina]KIG15880.1 putative membrane protein [Enhygromyxa salina]
MILINRRSWLRQLLLIRGTSLAWTWKRVSLATGIAIAATVLHEQRGSFDHDLSPLPFTLIGLALSIFLGFRNNTSYDRFWEGRKLWGALVNVARSFTRQLLTLVGPRMVDATSDHRAGEVEQAELRALRHALVHALIAYVHTLRHHLRDEDGLQDKDGIAQLEALLPPELVASLPAELNRPVAITQWIGEQLRALYDRGWIHPHHLNVLEGSLTEITAVQGACERIKSTPIPTSYTVLMHRIVALYCIGLPFGILSTVGTATPVVVAIVAYAFYGLDAVGTEIEDPFGLDPNDLPLTALSRMIEINLRQRLGEQELPALLGPVDGILQ